MSLNKKILTISHIAGNIMTSISVITTIEADTSSDCLGGRAKTKTNMVSMWCQQKEGHLDERGTTGEQRIKTSTYYMKVRKHFLKLK